MILDRFEKKEILSIKEFSKKVGIILLFLGILFSFFNLFFHIKIDIFIGIFLLIQSLIILYFFYKYKNTNRLHILQLFITFIAGAVFLTFPITHDLEILIILIFYLFLDGFIKGAISISYIPLYGYRWIIYSGVFSISFAIFLVIGWPLTNEWILKEIIFLNTMIDGIVFYNFAKRLENYLSNL